jgi:hypothetical protein
MEESSTYRMILQEGEKKQARKIALLVGAQELGTPDECDRTRLEGITDLERLEQMMFQAPTATSRGEILHTP